MWKMACKEEHCNGCNAQNSSDSQGVEIVHQCWLNGAWHFTKHQRCISSDYHRIKNHSNHRRWGDEDINEKIELRIVFAVEKHSGETPITRIITFSWNSLFAQIIMWLQSGSESHTIYKIMKKYESCLLLWPLAHRNYERHNDCDCILSLCLHLQGYSF